MMSSRTLSIALPALLLGSLAALGGACATAQGFDDANSDGGTSFVDGDTPQGEGGTGSDGTAPGRDGAATGNDGSTTGNDGAAGNDGAVGNDAASASDGAQAACTPGANRCSVGNSVEVCNSSGTAWLYSATCTVGCSNGLCTGACAPGAKRCNGSVVEACNATGTAYTLVETCSTFCDNAQCALASLDIALNRDMDGEILVAGAVIVRSGATLNSPTGNLTIRAKSITIENGGSIAAAPTGQTAVGGGVQGRWNGGSYYLGGGGGSYGSAGPNGNWSSPGAIYGSDRDSHVDQGAKGGDGTTPSATNGEYGGKGGGVLRLIADTISIAGQVTANGANGGPDTSCYGGGGGGSGGGILVAANTLTITGSVSAVGGVGGAKSSCSNSLPGGNGGDGRVKILNGATKSVTGALSGHLTQGLLPPLGLTSTSHPATDKIYNDDFPSLLLSWSKSFGSAQGYYVLVDQNPINVPTPASGQFISTDFASFPATALPAGKNYFHIVPVDATSNIGTVESTFSIQINTTAPAMSSTSHPNQAAWVDNANAFLAWTFPQGDANVPGAYYVFDQYGATVPTAAATFLPVGQKQLLRSGIAPGVWVLHVVSVDARGYLTKAAGHYRMNIGADPGSGGVVGQVVDGASQPVSGASVTVNRGLYTQTTNSTGNFNFGQVPAGSWEVTVTKQGHAPAVKPVTVVAGSATTANVTLP